MSGLTPSERREGYVSLLADIDEQWHPVGDADWRVQDGVLYCEPRGSGWLRTGREYGDFTLALEFAVSEECNSGVFLRTDEQGRPAFRGMEIQILDDAGSAPSVRSTGAVYAAQAPAENAMCPAGEWNRLWVRLVESELTVRLNGVTIQDLSLNEHTEKLDEDPPTPLSERKDRGYIGLQSHGEPRPAYFRRVRVREHPE